MEKREYQKTIDYIFELIEGGMIKVGDQLPTERKFSERLGISRNSIREALRTLENLGLVECRQGSGTYLTDRVSETFTKAINIMLMLKHTSRDEISRFRRNVEKSICSCLISKGCSEENRIAIGKALEALSSAKDLAELTEADTQFHYTLIRATNNSFMVTLMDSVADVFRKWIDNRLTIASDDMKRQLSEAHKKIALGVISCDMELCMNAIDEHYDIVDNMGDL